MSRTRIVRRISCSMVLATLALSIGGCSKDNPVTSTGTTTSALKPGSSFTMHGTTTSNGQILQSRDINTVVADVDLTVDGKTGVTRMVSDGGLTFVKYESNGDLSALMYLGFNGQIIDSVWVTYPFGSKGNSTVPTLTTTQSGGSVISSGTIAYIGSEQVTAAGETFQTEKIMVSEDARVGAPGQSGGIDDARIDTLWYAAKIGYFVRQSGVETVTIGSTGSLSTTVATNEAVLTAYKLQ